MKAVSLLWLPLLLAATACHRHEPEAKRVQPGPDRASASPMSSIASGTPTLPDFAVEAVATHEGNAHWYDVPDQSLPQRKAWTEEMTAASDTLPQDAYVRIRRLDGQGEPVVLRITDRGVHHKDVLVDVSHAAAEALGIVKTGTARVRVETLALKNASTDKPVEKKNEPTAPRITGTPAVSQRAEKDAANAKTGGQSAP